MCQQVVCGRQRTERSTIYAVRSADVSSAVNLKSDSSVEQANKRKDKAESAVYYIIHSAAAVDEICNICEVTNGRDARGHRTDTVRSSGVGTTVNIEACSAITATGKTKP
jgi:hypothetical protein